MARNCTAARCGVLFLLGWEASFRVLVPAERGPGKKGPLALMWCFPSAAPPPFSPDEVNR